MYIVSLSSLESNDQVSQTNTTNCMKCNISTWQIKHLFPVSLSVTKVFGIKTRISKPAVCFIPNQIKLSAHPYSNIWEQFRRKKKGKCPLHEYSLFSRTCLGSLCLRLRYSSHMKANSSYASFKQIACSESRLLLSSWISSHTETHDIIHCKNT